MRVPVYLMLLHLALLPAVALLRDRPAIHLEVRLVLLVAEAMAFAGCAAILIFGRLLPTIGLRVPGILRDLVMAAATVVAALSIAHRLGFAAPGIIATSAVVTAVVGLSFQEMLTNVVGGLSLQLDRSIDVGDWVRVGDVAGRVTEVRWRYTSVETRNGDVVLIPNSMVNKSQVTVLGRASHPRRTRRIVGFNVDFRVQPTEVIATVEAALAGKEIPGVALEPRPSCVLMELGESYARYALRYWLTDILHDDGTDSEVRTRVYFALMRAGMRLSIPAVAAFVTEETADRRQRKEVEELDRRRRVLASLELLSHVGEADLAELARRMKPAPFARGEIIHRQGDAAHFLYVLFDGTVEERVREGEVEETVCRLEAPSIFGETSMMTGVPRLATVVAVTDAECYRLDKDAFAKLVHDPEVAAHMAQVMARRRMEIDKAELELGKEADRRRLQQAETDILSRIRSFFAVVDERAM
jgi:small-conductance mechanosensitive channel